MDLLLWRHADAESGIPDEARRLSAEGRHAAGRVAQWLRARIAQDCRLVVSPARRAQETARAFAATFAVSPAVGTMATPASVFEAAGWPDAGGTVVIVGHQPTLGQAAAFALTGAEAQWSIAKGALWWLERREGEPLTRLRAVIDPDLV